MTCKRTTHAQPPGVYHSSHSASPQPGLLESTSRAPTHEERLGPHKLGSTCNSCRTLLRGIQPVYCIQAPPGGREQRLPWRGNLARRTHSSMGHLMGHPLDGKRPRGNTAAGNKRNKVLAATLSRSRQGADRHSRATWPKSFRHYHRAHRRL